MTNALCVAIYNRFYDTIAVLLENDVEIDYPVGVDGDSTPVLVACHHGDAKIVDMLITAHPEDFPSTTRTMKTPLAVGIGRDGYNANGAHKQDFLGVVKSLLRAGEDFRRRDEFGDTPLKIASYMAEEDPHDFEGTIDRTENLAILKVMKQTWKKVETNAILQLALGLKSLGLPVLLVTLVHDQLQECYGVLPLHERWNIARKVKNV